MNVHMNDEGENTDYISISEAERLTGIANATLKRYVLNHSHFVPHKKQGREYRIRLSDIETLKLIRKYYVSGLKREDINLKLEAGGLPITYTSNDSEGTELISVNETVQEVNRKLDLLMQFNQHLLNERENDKLEREAERDATRKELQEVKALLDSSVQLQQEALHVHQEALQERDKALAEVSTTLAVMQEEQSRGFFSKLFGLKKKGEDKPEDEAGSASGKKL